MLSSISDVSSFSTVSALCVDVIRLRALCIEKLKLVCISSVNSVLTLFIQNKWHTNTSFGRHIPIRIAVSVYV